MIKLQFWLKQGSETLRLPVPPKEYMVKRNGNNESFKVEGMGEISFIGKTGLASCSIESLFPKTHYSFCEYRNFPKPQKCVEIIERFWGSGKPVRYTITGTKLNMLCTIESFEYGEKDGTGDIFYTLELKEYRQVVLQTTSVKSANILAKREVTKQVPNKCTVKKGDTPYSIAKRVYGDGNRYKEILTKNNFQNFNTLSTIVRVGMSLIV